MSSPSVLEGGKKNHKKHEHKRGRSGLSRAEQERVSKKVEGSSLVKDAEAAYDDAARAKVAAGKGEWETAEMDERNAADSESYVERGAKKAYVKRAAVSAETKEVTAAKKIRTAMQGGSTETLAGGDSEAVLAGGDASPVVLAGGELEGGADLKGGKLEGGADLAGGELEGGSADLEGGKKGAGKTVAKKAVGEAKASAKKAEYEVLREVSGVHVGHTEKIRSRREKSRSRSPKHRNKSPKKQHKEGSPKRELPHAFKMWSEARNKFFEGKKQKGVLEKGSREYEEVRRIYDGMRR